MGILRSNSRGNMKILRWFLAPAPGGIPEIYGLYFSRGGGGDGVLVWCSGVMGMTVPLSGFIYNTLGLAERQQQKSGSVLIVKIKNLQEPIQQLVVRSVIILYKDWAIQCPLLANQRNSCQSNAWFNIMFGSHTSFQETSKERRECIIMFAVLAFS